jgi:serine protease Do
VALLVVDVGSVPIRRPLYHVRVSLGAPADGSKCLALGYSGLTTRDLADGIGELRAPLHGSHGEIEEVHPSRRDRSFIDFPCFRTSAWYASGMSGGPVFAEDGNVVGLVSLDFRGVGSSGSRRRF